MSHKSALELMQESVGLKNQITIVRLITNDLLNSFLLNGLEEKKLYYDSCYYKFDLHNIILESMNFTQDEIMSDAGDWYFKKQKEVIINPKAMKETNIGNTAIKLFFEIKEYRRKTEKKDLS